MCKGEKGPFPGMGVGTELQETGGGGVYRCLISRMQGTRPPKRDQAWVQDPGAILREKGPEGRAGSRT